MRKYLFIILLASFAFPALSHASSLLSINYTDSIPAKEAANHYNQTLKVYGTVSGGRWLQSSKVTLINVEGAYPNHALTLMIKDEDRSKFNYAPEEFLKGKKIMVTGKVIEYKGKPEIVVTEAEQIAVLE